MTPDHQAPGQGPSTGKGCSNKTIVLLIVVVGLVFMAFFGCIGAAVFGGLSLADQVERTYYPECETLASSEACERCCEAHGHSGHASGSLINEAGKTCGCF